MQLESHLRTKPTRCTIFSLCCFTAPLHVSGQFVVHQQEVVECMMWRMVLVLLISRPLAGLDKKEPVSSYPGLPTVNLQVQQITFTTLYTQPPDDGLQMSLKHVEA
jgi:hypothetical protein